MEMLYAGESYALRGAFYEVYSTLGAGFLESVYQEALELELASRGIPYIAQPQLELLYKNVRLRQTYRPDFVCYDHIIVELKAAANLAAEHQAQLVNYLRVTGFRLGFLVNFGHYPQIEIKRMVF